MKKNFNLTNLTRALTLLLGVLVLIGLNSCSKDDDAVADPTLVLDVGESISVSNKGGERNIGVVSNQAWTATSDAGWIELTQASGEAGKGAIKFTIEENEGEERTGNITVTAGSASKKISITQETGITNDFYVKEGGTGEGTSWGDATTLAKALKIASSGSTIHVAAGTHVPTETITGGDDANDGDITFEIASYITVIGGYPADATGGASADPENNKTILSGKLPGGSETYHVVTVSAPKTEGSKVVLQGLTITEGHGTDRGTKITNNDIGFDRGNGAGLTIGNATVDIINCEITGNRMSKDVGEAGYAAGVFVHNGSVVTFKNTKISKNENLVGNGGGLWIDRSTAYIYDSEISENSGATGAGIHAYPDAEVYVYNSKIINNKGRSYGPSFYIRDNSKGVLVNSIIDGNSSTKQSGGGVMVYQNSVVDIISSTIINNEVPNSGGGVYKQNGSNTVNIYNSIIAGNSQNEESSEIDVNADDSGPAIGVHSSVIDNKAYDESGNEIADVSFNIGSMLNADLVPVGSNNPAIDKGMSSGALNTLKSTFDPILEDLISSDLNGKSRSGKTTMGALVE